MMEIGHILQNVNFAWDFIQNLWIVMQLEESEEILNILHSLPAFWTREFLE